MASLSTSSTGVRRILFVDRDGQRRQIHLGKMHESAAGVVFDHVEHLLASGRAGVLPRRATSDWLFAIDDKMHARLARVDLVEPRKRRDNATLGQLIERFEKASNVAASTRAVHRRAADLLLAHFGEDRLLKDIGPEDAQLWRRSLVEAGYATATVAKMTHVAKRFFGVAESWALITANPFSGIRPGSQRNPARTAYVPVEDIERAMEHAPDARWRALLGLCRFAGLRCPSELSGLTWADVDLLDRRLVVASPKTSRYEGHESRSVPIAPRLAPLLEDLYELAEEGEPLLFPGLANSSNLRTTFTKIIRRAGLTPWPRLFQNLRASCATDWAAAFPNRDAAAWLGHSPMIAAQHYTKPRDEHFRQAAGLPASGSSAHNRAQISTRQGAAPTGTERKPSREGAENERFMPLVAGACRSVPVAGMGGRGLEPRTLRV